MRIRFVALSMLLAVNPARVPAGTTTNLTFVAFDIETTGLSARTDRIVEIGAVKFRDEEIIGTLSTLVNPVIPIPPAAREIHGISDSMVRNAPRAREALRTFLEFTGDSVLVAHNAAFDLRFVSAEAERNGLQIGHRTTIDTLPLARKWWPESTRHSLAALAEHLELPAARSHRALADAHRVHLIFLAGLAKDEDVIGIRDPNQQNTGGETTVPENSPPKPEHRSPEASATRP